MAIWNHDNNLIFHNQKCNFVQIIEQARHTYLYTVLYKSTNMNNLDVIAGNKAQDKTRTNNIKQWSPALVNWLNWNIDASRIASKHSSTVRSF